MEEKETKVKEKKRGISLIAFLLILIILILVAGFGYMFYENRIANQEIKQYMNTIATSSNVTKTNTNNNGANSLLNTNVTGNNVIGKIDDSKALVYMVKVSKTNGSDIPEYNGEVELPQINLDTENIKRINQEIIRKCSTNKNKSLDKVNVSKYIDNNTISLHIELTDLLSSVETEHYVYNFDAKTGKELKNDDLLLRKGITKKQVADKIEKIFEGYETGIQYEKNRITNLSDDIINEIISKSRNANGVNNENNISIPLFINSNGKLSAVLWFEYIVGGGLIQEVDVVE